MPQTFTARSAVAALVAAVALLVAAPAALASLNYTGKSSQGNDFTLRTDDAGIPERASYGWDMNCKGGGSLTNGGTISTFGQSNFNGFKSSGKYEGKIENKFVGQFKVKLEGERQSDTRFTGTFKVKAKVYKKRNDELVTKCSTGIVRWTADLNSPPIEPQPPRSAGTLRLR